MEDSSLVEDSANLSCSNCGSTVKPEEKFCSNCSYPHNGTDEERGQFQSKIGAKKRLLKVINKEVRKAKNTLIFLGVVNIIFGIIFGLLGDDIALVVGSAILAIIYFGLAIWSDKQPFGAILTALILYGTLILLQAAVDPSTIFQGIVLKIIIIVLLVKGLNSGLEAKKVMKELDELGIKGG